MTDAVVTGHFAEVLSVSASSARAEGVFTHALTVYESSAMVSEAFVNVLRSTPTNPLLVGAQYVEVLRGGPVAIDAALMHAHILRDTDASIDVSDIMVQVLRETTPIFGSGSGQYAVTIISG